MSTATSTAARPSRRKVAAGTRVDFWLDGALLVAFALDYSFRFTGLTVHEWVGVGLGVALIVHVTLHWDWVLKTPRRLFASYAGREKLRWILDLALIGAMTLCIGSGVLISRSALPAIGIDTVRDPFWTGLHTTTADVCVALVGLHVALSWRWIVAVGRRLLVPRSATARSRSMKFLRQTLAVIGVVAAIMALGFAMKHSPASSLVTDQRQGRVDATRVAPAPAGQVRGFEGHDGGRDQGFDLSRVDDLVQSLLILGAIIAGVIVIDRLRRRRTPIVDSPRSTS